MKFKPRYPDAADPSHPTSPLKDGRNNRFMDLWSIAHFLEGVTLTLVVPWWVAWLLLAAWEPVETLWVYKRMARWFRIRYGFEGPINIIGDLVFNSLGVAATYFLVLPWFDPFGLR